LKSLLFISGTRADFGKLEPLAIAARDNGFKVSFFVTGMHMLHQYGLTKNEVRNIKGIQVHEFLNQREIDSQDIILSKTVNGFSDFCREDRPDLVIIHGDRIEALACAIVCATNYIRFAHIEGGEVSGTIDETFRHCNTKLANYHFVSSEEAKMRVMAMGEAEDSIYVIGSPELDFHSQLSGVSLSDVKSHYGINFDSYGIVVFHPVTSELDTIEIQAKSLFDSLIVSGHNFVVISPNNDPGADLIRSVIRKLPTDCFRVLPSMRFAHFSELMRNASAIIGNSSIGVREAPFLGVPTLDIGSRQTRRAKAESITHLPAFDHDGILKFITSRWGKHYSRHVAFGEGRATHRFIEVIKSDRFWSGSLQKRFID
jgi:UDP-N-acetylglucosamine 2-epimerase (hydrolysing)